MQSCYPVALMDGLTVSMGYVLISLSQAQALPIFVRSRLDISGSVICHQKPLHWMGHILLSMSQLSEREQPVGKQRL